MYFNIMKHNRLIKGSRVRAMSRITDRQIAMLNKPIRASRAVYNCAINYISADLFPKNVDSLRRLIFFGQKTSIPV